MNLKKDGARQGGFTLIELMVVVVILGLLATVGAVGFRKLLRGSQDDIAKTRCKEIEKALETMVIRNGGITVPADEAIEKLVDIKMIKRKDLKDPWGEEFEVVLNEDDEYQVYSKGKDKQSDTDDDVYSDGIASERNK